MNSPVFVKSTIFSKYILFEAVATPNLIDPYQIYHRFSSNNIADNSAGLSPKSITFSQLDSSIIKLLNAY